MVVSPAGHPDMVYIGGSFDYNLFGNGINNGRAVLLSQDAGATWTDQTRDNADPTTGIHPDQHALAVDPANPLLFFEGSDGGVVHSSGKLTDASANCNPNLGPYSATCTELLSAVPTQDHDAQPGGLSTLQYQSVAVNPFQSTNLMGGTQDNGTWNGSINSLSWPQTIYGDGGQSGYDSGNSSIRFMNFYSPYSDENFENGDPTAWVIVSGNFFNCERRPERGLGVLPAGDRRSGRRPARSSRASSTSGGPWTTAATRRRSRRTAPSSPRSADTPGLR